VLHSSTRDDTDLQRCAHYVPGLRSMPWWDSAEFPAVTLLEDNYEPIRNEFLNLLLCGQLKLHPQSRGGPRRQLADGDWNIFELFSHGCVNAANATLTPHTVRTLTRLSDVTTHPSGLSYFSVLNPGVHIAPHCGPTNSRIRIHLGLRVPSGAAMRVGRETRSWHEGRCAVFDDSWEHEVFNGSECLRAVLLLDVWHPDLTAEQRSQLVALRPRRKRNDAKRQQERTGWINETRLSDNYAGPSLRVLVGLEHLREMIASVSKARNSRHQILSMLHTFASQSMNTTAAPAVAGPSVSGSAVCRELWPALLSLLTEHPSVVSIEDVINMIYLGCAYWRSWPGNEALVWSFMDRCTSASRRLLFESPSGLQGASEVLRWCDVHGEGAFPFGALAASAVVAIREISLR
jgi:aspartyl/asparaginyl beta-hydroxylase (cupin superfamily)